MIWNVENKVTHKIDTWYPSDLIEILIKRLKALGHEGTKALSEVVKVIEGAKNET